MNLNEYKELTEKLGPEATREIVALVQHGKTIESVKRTRELSGLELKPAKEFVDTIKGLVDKKNTGAFGTIVVSRSIRVSAEESVTGDVINEELPPVEDLIEVIPFVQEPAKVGMSKGLTINTGNFSSARVDVSIELPCYKEEIGYAMEQASGLVDARLGMEVEQVKAYMDSKKKK